MLKLPNMRIQSNPEQAAGASTNFPIDTMTTMCAGVGGTVVEGQHLLTANQ